MKTEKVIDVVFEHLPDNILIQKYETKLIKNYIIKYKAKRSYKMVEKINKELITHYGKSIYSKNYKRVITKLANGKFNVTTYYKENGINKTVVSKIDFNEKQIEKLIEGYLQEFNCKKTLEFN